MEFLFFIGIDVSKSTLDIGLLDSKDVGAVNHKQVSNNDAGIAAMLSWLKEQNGFSIESSLFCLEHAEIDLYSERRASPPSPNIMA